MKESWIVHSSISLRKSETKRFDLRMSEMWINGLRADINVIGKHDEVVNIVRVISISTKRWRREKLHFAFTRIIINNNNNNDNDNNNDNNIH